MMKDQIHNKEMQPAESSESRGNLYCQRECEIPGVGLFERGQKVEDHKQYVLLKDHPFFSNQAPEAK